MELADHNSDAIHYLTARHSVAKWKYLLIFCGLYRWFVSCSAQIAAILKRNVKKAIQWHSMLLHGRSSPDWRRYSTGWIQHQHLHYKEQVPLTLDTNACVKQMGCALMEEQFATKKPLSDWYISLNALEQNYNTAHRELPAVVWTSWLLRPYLENHKFTICTYHIALE